jgi:hypothetical protein
MPTMLSCVTAGALASTQVAKLNADSALFSTLDRVAFRVVTDTRTPANSVG